MTINLTPEQEALIQKRLESGAFQSVEDVLWRALESQDAEADRGERMTPEKSRAWLEEQKAEWHSEQRHR